MRILVVAHNFPPLNSSASRRPYSWARAWADAGHDVQVLTTAKYALDGRTDAPLDCTGFAVHEVAYLPLAPQPVTLPGEGAHAAPRLGPVLRAVQRATRRLRLGMGLFTQTPMAAWPALVRRGLALHAERAFDFMISTSGPEVCTFAAHSLARRAGIPWIADYRDLWFDEFAVQRYAFTTWATGALNRRMLRRARMASTISEGLAGYLRRAARCPVVVSYNGYLDVAEPRPHAWADDRVHLVYTGNFYPEKRDPRPLFDVLARARGLRGKLCIDVFGPKEEWLLQRIAQAGLQDMVIVHGEVPYAQSIGAQRSADALLFVDWMDARAEGVLTGKLFEYLASGRPILCIGTRADTEAARMIVACRAGEVAVAPERIDAALADVAAGRFTAAADPGAVARYSRGEQARILLRAIEEALAARTVEWPR